MKKLMIAAMLSVFTLSAASAFACDGMKGHEKSSENTSAKKQDKGKADTTKPDQKS